MTFPIFVCAHVIYGVVMAFAMERRMRSEGEVLGLPLIAALLPVAVASTPIGAILLRYAGGWFLHGLILGEGSIPYERFHLGLMLLVSGAAAIATVFGIIAAIAMLSREKRKLALVPAAIALVVAAGIFASDPMEVLRIPGTGGRMLWSHPAGLVSLALLACFVAAWAFVRARLSAPVDVRL